MQTVRPCEDQGFEGPVVWLLQRGELNEGGQVEGVYLSRDLAVDDFVDLVRDLANRFGLDEGGTGEEPNGAFYAQGGCDWISLAPFPVRTRRQLRP